MKHPLSRASLVLLAALSLVSRSSYAASFTWNVNGNSTWGTTANWLPNTGIPNAAGDVANVTNNITTNVAIDLGSVGRTVGILNIGDTNNSNSFTLNSGTLILNNLGSGAQLNQVSTSAANTINTTVLLNDNATINNSSTNSLTINSAITGSSAFALTKTGAGALVLANGNTFAGGFNINGGTVQTNGSGALGTGVVTVNSGGMLQSTNNNMGTGVAGFVFNGGTYRGLANNSNFTGQGNVTVTGTNASTFISDLAGGSYTQYAFGTLSIGTSQLTATIRNSSGGSPGGTGQITFGNTTLTGDATFRMDNAGLGGGIQTNLGALNDSGTAHSITTTGNGTLNLGTTATSLVAGTQVFVSETSTLNVSANNALGTLALVDVASAAKFQANSGTVSVGALQGAGTTSLSINNTFVVGNSANNLSSTYSGIINGGNSSSTILKAGTGTWTLSGSNSTFLGTLTVAAGQVNVSSLSSTGTNSLGGANVTIGSGTGTIGTLAYTGATANTNKTINFGNGGSLATSGTGVIQVDNASTVLTLSGAVGGFGTMVKSGSGTVLLNNGGNGMQAGIIVNGGKLQASGANGNSDPTSGVLGSYKNGSGARTITVNNGGTLEFLTGNIFGTDGNSNYVSLVINGGGALTSANSAAGSNFFQNLLTINGGGTLVTGTGVSTGAQSYRLNNDVAVGVGNGTAASITAGVVGPFNGVNLRNATTTTFTVADATSSSAVDLIVSANLIDQGGSALTKSGAGTMLLSGSNTYTGLTTVSGGVIQLGSANALGTAAAGTTVTGSSTLDLNGQVIGAEAVSVSGTGVSGGGALVNNNTGTAASLSGVVAMTAATNLGGAGNLTLSSTLAGAFAVNKVGNGTLTLSATNSYSGATTVSAGTLLVSSNGRLASTSVTVNSGGAFVYNNNTTAYAGTVVVNGILGGSGRINGTIGGSGQVGPGNSPGILTAAAVNPTSGLGFAFEFTSTGAPTYGNNTASVNDVLRLTDGSTPFTASLDSSNPIKIYLNVGTLTAGDVFDGGFYTDKSASFLASIANATYQYYLFNAGGSTTYNGVNYDLYSGPLTFTVNSVAQTANFGAGNVNGFTTEFVVAPEPSTIALIGLGFGAALFGYRRRKLQP